MLFIVIILSPIFVFGQMSSTKPIGAKITQPNQIAGKPNKVLQDAVMCAAKDWMELTPIGNTGAGPGIYFVPFHGSKGPRSISDSRKNKYLKGMIKTKVDMETCVAPGGAPVPSHEITMYAF